MPWRPTNASAMLATLVSPRKAIGNGSVKVMGKAGTQSAKPGGVCFI